MQCTDGWKGPSVGCCSFWRKCSWYQATERNSESYCGPASGAKRRASAELMLGCRIHWQPGEGRASKRDYTPISGYEVRKRRSWNVIRTFSPTAGSLRLHTLFQSFSQVARTFWEKIIQLSCSHSICLRCYCLA